MWEPGPNYNFPIINVNEELMKLKGTLEDEEAKVTFVKFLEANPNFAASLLFGVELYPIQDIALKMMFKRDFVLNIWSRGFGKCIEENSLLFTDKGIKKIKDVEVGGKVLAEESEQLVLNKWENPISDGFKVTTSKGTIFSAIKGHRSLTLDHNIGKLVYKNIEDLKVGDYLVGKIGGNLWGKETILDKIRDWLYTNPEYLPSGFDINKISATDFCYFLGVLLGDGYFDPKTRRISITSADSEIINSMQSVAASMGVQFKEIYQDRIASELRCDRKFIIDLLLHLGFTKKLAHQKNIPDCLLSLNKEELGAILSGLFDTDGTVTTLKRFSASITSSSKEMCDTIRLLMSNFGIESTLAKDFDGGPMNFPNGKVYNCRPAWSITFAGYNAAKSFSENINFRLTRKRNRLDLYLNCLQVKFKQILIPKMGAFLKKVQGVYPNLTKNKLGTDLKNPERNRHAFPSLGEHLSENRAEQISEYLTSWEKDTVDRTLKNKLIYEEIKAIEPLQVKTYDITVDKEECYVANGLIHHNSTIAAIFIGLYAIFNPGVKIGICSKTARQSRAVFKQLEDFCNDPKNTFFRKCVKSIKKDPDAWVMEIGRSRIFALPLGDAGRIRGYRFNVMVIDELLLLSAEVINEVIRPFLAVNFDPVERQKFLDASEILLREGKVTREELAHFKFSGQKLIGLSSASYTFEFLYKMLQDYEKRILIPSVDQTEDISHAVMQLSYKVAPRGLLNEKQIKEAKDASSAAQFAREFESQFTDDSAGFFAIRKLEEATFPVGGEICTRIYGNKDKKYVLSIDPNYSDSELSDHFAMCLLELNEKERKATMVHGYALSKSNTAARAFYIKYLLKHFNIVYVAYDNAGGSRFLSDINDMPLFKDDGLQLVDFEADFENLDYKEGLKNSKKSYDLTKNKICHAIIFNKGEWIRAANEYLQACIEHKRITFAGTPGEKEFDAQKSAKIPIAELMYDDSLMSVEEGKLVDFIEHQDFIIKLTKTECATIQVSTSANGRQVFDLPDNLKRLNTPDRPRKDSYTALLLANWGVKCYFDMMDVEVKREAFVPFGYD